MEVRRVERAKPPAYPDKEASLRDPTLLLNAPERWKRNAAACAALAATSAMLFSSCEPASGEAMAPVPFFEHGVGRGGFGCMSVAPPAFLSEAEAFDVISEVAKEENFSFEANGLQLKGVELPITTTLPNPDNDKFILGTKKATILLDGVNTDKKIAYEFVSTEDIQNWEKKKTGYGASYTSFNFIDTAKSLNKGLNKAKSGMAVAVFYDPGYRKESAKIFKECDYNEALAVQKIKELVKEDLRAQVRDFIAWLKAQGII